jgi:hypothetical protein
MLEKEFKYYIDNQKELLNTYNGLYIVIKDNEVIGSYSSELEALLFTQKTEEIGTFLIQFCSPGENAYTQTFHSRVAF